MLQAMLMQLASICDDDHYHDDDGHEILEQQALPQDRLEFR
jgi:hypothetical protein